MIHFLSDFFIRPIRKIISQKISICEKNQRIYSQQIKVKKWKNVYWLSNWIFMLLNSYKFVINIKSRK